MAITTTRTPDQFVALCDQSLETGITTCTPDTTNSTFTNFNFGTGGGTGIGPLG